MCEVQLLETSIEIASSQYGSHIVYHRTGWLCFCPYRQFASRTIKHMSPETVQRSFYKYEFSTIDLSEKQENENKDQDLKLSPSQDL